MSDVELKPVPIWELHYVVREAYTAASMVSRDRLGSTINPAMVITDAITEAFPQFVADGAKPMAMQVMGKQTAQDLLRTLEDEGPENMASVLRAIAGDP